MASTDETPIEWLRSHLGAMEHPDCEAERRLVTQAIAGLMERDELRFLWESQKALTAEMVNLLRASGGEGDHLSTLALSIRDQRDQARDGVMTLQAESTQRLNRLIEVRRMLKSIFALWVAGADPKQYRDVREKALKMIMEKD